MLTFDLKDPKTAEVIAAKLRAAMRYAPNVKAAAIARACSVKPQAVSGWTRTGRIDKKHLATLASMTGTTLDWWMDGRIDSLPEASDRTSPPPRAAVVQEELGFYGSPTTSRLIKAFERLSSADQERYLAEIEKRGDETQAIIEEFKKRDSPAAAAFGPAVSDRDVERKMNLQQHHKPR